MSKTPAPFLLFHWSPTARRKQITRNGMVPGSRSLDGAWRPPYICFADSPSLAWALSGRFHPEVTSWDLWQTWSNRTSGYEEIYDHDRDGDSYVKEYRIYERIKKKHLWYVATREAVKR